MKFKVLATAVLLAVAGKAYSQTFTNPTDPSMPNSWFIQGEYYGQFEDNGARLGAQVRAVVNNYRIHFTVGGLPGDATWPMGGWNYNWSNLVTSLLTFNNGTMAISGTNVTATLTIPGNVKTALNTDKVIAGTLGGRAFRLNRVERKSPTEGMTPVTGAQVLFDGTQASFTANWRNSGGGSYVTDKQSIYRGLNSVLQHQDMFLHIEFLSAYMPDKEDQARSNSGIYLQNRYEQQIMDSFGERGLENNSKGALYGSLPALRNAALPPLVNWETYDIYFTAAKYNGSTKTANARFKTWLNGVKVQDSEMPQPGTGGSPEGPSAGIIHLQNHNGDPIYFRNIWAVTTPANFPDTTLFGRCSDGSSVWSNPNKNCQTTQIQSRVHASKPAQGAGQIIQLQNGKAILQRQEQLIDLIGRRQDAHHIRND
jgi:Domain of Unknown Function (DUF1080)